MSTATETLINVESKGSPYETQTEHAGNGYLVRCKERLSSGPDSVLRILAFELAGLRHAPNGIPEEEDWIMAELLNSCDS